MPMRCLTVGEAGSKLAIFRLSGGAVGARQWYTRRANQPMPALPGIRIPMKRVLMIAYHYPPMRGSSGLQRTLKFSNYLLSHDWQATVLSVNPRAYVRTGDDQLGEIPEQVQVKRAFAVDAARHLSIRGAYPDFLAWPDRWSSWWLGAVPTGLNLIRKLSPDVIWSTYPIATAHLIGLTLARLSKVPWVADFRDSMSEDDYPPDPRTRAIYRWIEKRTVHRAAHSVFTTPGTTAMYRERYPDCPESAWACIPNGYDEDNFRGAQSLHADASTGDRPQGPLRFVHSGILYPSERDPRAFFAALAELRDEGRLDADAVQIVLRATAHDDKYRPMLEQHNINDLVSLEPSVSYQEALAEMLAADGLLLFQAANCNHQIPAKLYEYFRSGRPILALTDSVGDTAGTMRTAGVGEITQLDNKDDIKLALMRFIQGIRNGTAKGAQIETASAYSRKTQSAVLADLLDSVVES